MSTEVNINDVDANNSGHSGECPHIPNYALFAHDWSDIPAHSNSVKHAVPYIVNALHKAFCGKTRFFLGEWIEYKSALPVDGSTVLVTAVNRYGESWCDVATYHEKSGFKIKGYTYFDVYAWCYFPYPWLGGDDNAESEVKND